MHFWFSVTEETMKKQEGNFFSIIGQGLLICILGLVAAVVLPNLTAIQNRLREGQLADEMYTFERAVKHYSREHRHTPPSVPADVIQYLPEKRPQKNPYTGEEMLYNSDAPGNISFAIRDSTTYEISGTGKYGYLDFVLSGDLKPKAPNIIAQYP